MNASRVISAIATIAIGVAGAWNLAPFGIVAQVMPLIASVSLATVLILSGWQGFTVAVFAYVCTFFCSFAALVLSSPYSERGEELPYIFVGAACGCFVGILAARHIASRDRLFAIAAPDKPREKSPPEKN